MKIQILDQTGNKTKEVETKIFDSEVRQDIVQKIVEVEKQVQPYSPSPIAGMQTSASGNVRHLRHSWKTDRGRGMSRIPKKRMWDRGARFHWVGAVIPGTVGGRRAHPPKTLIASKKINKKEFKLGLKSALAMNSSLNLLKEKYDRLKDKEMKLKLPLVIEEKVLELKTKEFLQSLNKILQEAVIVAIQKKKIRAGKGTKRNRKYKKNAGLLLVLGNEENKRINGIDIVNVRDVTISDLASNGARLTIFTEKAIKDLEAKLK